MAERLWADFLIQPVTFLFVSALQCHLPTANCALTEHVLIVPECFVALSERGGREQTAALMGERTQPSLQAACSRSNPCPNSVPFQRYQKLHPAVVKHSLLSEMIQEHECSTLYTSLGVIFKFKFFLAFCLILIPRIRGPSNKTSTWPTGVWRENTEAGLGPHVIGGGACERNPS